MSSYDRYWYVDESSLNEIDRLGLAYCRLNGWEWDEFIGPKPDGFDGFPNCPPDPWYVDECGEVHSIEVDEVKGPFKHDYISPMLKAIEDKIGEENCSRCWWIFQLEKTEDEWQKWYYRERIEYERELQEKYRAARKRYKQQERMDRLNFYRRKIKNFLGERVQKHKQSHRE